MISFSARIREPLPLIHGVFFFTTCILLYKNCKTHLNHFLKRTFYLKFACINKKAICLKDPLSTRTHTYSCHWGLCLWDLFWSLNDPLLRQWLQIYNFGTKLMIFEEANQDNMFKWCINSSFLNIVFSYLIWYVHTHTQVC